MLNDNSTDSHMHWSVLYVEHSTFMWTNVRSFRTDCVDMWLVVTRSKCAALC